MNKNQWQVREGAELNTEKTRAKCGMKTAWRLLEDAYGRYKDYDCIEAEEVVTETNTFSFADNMLCRTLNWLIQMSWTLRRHDVILKVLQDIGLSPADFLMRVIRNDHRAPDGLRRLIVELERVANAELFPYYKTRRELIRKPEELEN